jgi:molybdopterin adenylyltransferase
MRIAVLTISDRSSKGDREDRTGPVLAKMISSLGWDLVKTGISSDDKKEIETILREWADSGGIDILLTAGGTGFSPRDCAPEATGAVVERYAPGIAEAMRSGSLRITPHAMLSRGIAGIRGKTLIINLPGSPKAAKENLQIVLPVLPHAIQLLSEDPGAEAGHQFPTQMKRI